MSDVMKIEIEDCGQDFTEWYVRDGIVIDCQPLQGRMWVGSRVRIDWDRISVKTPQRIGYMPLKYRATKVSILSQSEAEQVEGYGRKWAQIIGLPVESLGLTA